MERLWLKHYPAGVPAEVNFDYYPSVAALFEESFARFKDDKAYICMDKSVTYGDIDLMSRDLAAYLQGLGLKKGDRVALMMPNLLQYPVAIAAVLRAGFIAVNVNPLYTPRELEHQLRDSGALAIIILENFAATLQQVIRNTSIKHVVVSSVGDLLGFAKGTVTNFVVRRVKKAVPAWSLPGSVSLKAALATGRHKPLDAPDLQPDDVAVLQYTGGTTGVAKGATLLHRTIIANLLASEAWMQPGIKRKPTSGQLTFICALPLYHVFAFISCGLLAMRAGGVNILIPNPRDIPGMVKEMAKYRFHLIPGVNTLFNALASNPDFARLDFSQLRIANGGAMAVQEAVARKWLEVTGCPIVEGYGLSETSAGIACNPTDNDAFTGTIGLPLPNVEIRLLDDDGNDVPHGAPGEISIKGPQVMAGYWQRPDETAKVMTPDGFFKSGDVGIMDDRGYVKIVDRKKDMILVSGFNVYPNEIEDVVASHPGVQECAVVGVPDKNSGEAVMVFVVKRDPTLTKEVLQEYCAKNLTGYKKPKHIEFRTDLPRTNVGKILRRELRDEVMKKSA
ncbi:long-chain-fatty-acid--CoA ligase [Mesorhizobium sp. L-8-10]|uniref:long-chain-fatty-acid--CoA ligase n=1 Tax=unclassified Mesorhizobium TaxID=325217 RepID=UPI0019277063|nr:MULTISPECIES: long-chain-fatty-acid--CoA ligase [unclassified Mesorhizobium]BCH24476.1 long-chain-fatty-acid--CoA ligase [Mesorhizobium sp. L-8-3]BCH32210.1 long-chain-fatty-acid--CoA ligase [Mesorhizobium sp. L-8-10]